MKSSGKRFALRFTASLRRPVLTPYMAREVAIENHPFAAQYANGACNVFDRRRTSIHPSKHPHSPIGVQAKIRLR